MVKAEYIIAAYEDCRKGKASSPDAIRFETYLFENITDLVERINSRTYEPMPSITFVVSRPVYREVFAANFRDRVIHHYIALRLEPLFEDIIASNDMQSIKNCVTIMADCCEVGMNDSVMLDMMKQVKGEIGACHYDEEMADVHLCLIDQLHTKDVVKDYWHEVKNNNINLEDWCVLWGEIVKRNDAKIKKWFTKINTLDFERKIFDECVSFLENGGMPYYDLNI